MATAAAVRTLHGSLLDARCGNKAGTTEIPDPVGRVEQTSLGTLDMLSAANPTHRAPRHPAAGETKHRIMKSVTGLNALIAADEGI